jgi:hypothetical protein
MVQLRKINCGLPQTREKQPSGRCYMSRSSSRRPGIARRGRNGTSDDGASDDARESRSILDRSSPYLPEWVAHSCACLASTVERSAILAFTELAKTSRPHMLGSTSGKGVHPKRWLSQRDSAMIDKDWLFGPSGPGRG